MIPSLVETETLYLVPRACLDGCLILPHSALSTFHHPRAKRRYCMYLGIDHRVLHRLRNRHFEARATWIPHPRHASARVHSTSRIPSLVAHHTMYCKYIPTIPPGYRAEGSIAFRLTYLLPTSTAAVGVGSADVKVRGADSCVVPLLSST